MNIISVLRQYMYVMPAQTIILPPQYLSWGWTVASCVTFLDIKALKHCHSQPNPTIVPNWACLGGCTTDSSVATAWPGITRGTGQIPRKIFCHRIASMLACMHQCLQGMGWILIPFAYKHSLCSPSDLWLARVIVPWFQYIAHHFPRQWAQWTHHF